MPFKPFKTFENTFHPFGKNDSERIYTAYVDVAGNDGTAELYNAGKAFLTINAALTAILGIAGKVSVHIGVGVFGPINGDDPGTTLMRDNLSFYGSGTPTIKGDRSGLENGTIIKGPLWVERNGFEMYNLGFDCGSAVCTADYGGVAQQGFLMVDTNSQIKPAKTGFIARGITVICQSYNAAVHAFLVENTVGAILESITTMYGFAGFVIKSSGARANNINGTAHNSAAILCKSDVYAVCDDVIVSDVVVNSVAPGDCKPILFNLNGAALISNCEINGVTNNTNQGVFYTASTGVINNCDVVDLTGVNAVTKVGVVTNSEVNGGAV